MNFFERQAEARRQSRLFVALFVLAVLVIVIILNLVTFTLLVLFTDPLKSVPNLSFFEWVGKSVWAFSLTTLIVLGQIGVASLHKMSQLRAGGSAVAESLGATWISPRTTKLKERQVLNIVDELSIASGLPVPDVYLLERESGINTFSAGYNPGNAAIVITQGALTRLDRAELQGVIAHEISHVLNGDMLLNIRLMAPLHGLMFMSIAARSLLTLQSSGSYLVLIVSTLVLGVIQLVLDVTGTGLSLESLLVLGAIQLVIGYIGLFFGRIIQAAVSRRREMLADAMAIQLTRDSSGLKGALMKVNAMAFGSYLHHPQAEAVAHMLFAQGTIRSFETHPTLLARIKAIDPTFNEAEIDEMHLRSQAKTTEVEINKRLSPHRLDHWSSTPLTSADVVDLVGNPAADHLDFAQFILGNVPLTVLTAGQQPTSARALLLALALDSGSDSESNDRRKRQLRFISLQLVPSIATAVSDLGADVAKLSQAQRIPSLLRVFPALRHLPLDERRQLLACLTMMLQREGISPYLYALRKLAQVHLTDDLEPRTRLNSLALSSVQRQLQVLFSVLAHYGNSDPPAVFSAYAAGMQYLFPKGWLKHEFPISWHTELDTALDRLDQLSPLAKGKLVEALVKTIVNDRRLLLGEAELLRAVCGSIHCPLPPLMGAES